jgi:hypothetical protein
VKQPRVFLLGPVRLCAALAGLAVGSLYASGQAPPSSAKQSLADSVAELRTQVQELRAAVAEMKSEAAQYRTESAELRKELESLRAAPESAPGNVTAASEAGQPPQEQGVDLAKRVAALEETNQLTQSELRTQYQTKVESAAKYRVRFSGLALFNLFENRGVVDNLDFPTYATAGNAYGTKSAFGATLRQSQFGMEVFGPELAGAKTRGEVQFDFGGGFPTAALDGINLGLVRLRTASMRLDWDRTSVVVGQDNLFLSPDSPTSFASLAIPSLGYSGNLWAWTPQVRIEHTFDLADGQNLILQAGILDNVTGEPSYGSRRQPQSGESSGLPAYAVRTGWSKSVNGRPLTIGVSGYYSRQNWGFDWDVDGWAAATDWKVPVNSKWELSGEFYRGRAVGGVGGGIGQSILFSGNPLDPSSDFRGLNSAGGWSQIKFAATSRLEFNGAVGIDAPFSKDTRAFAAPIGYYPTVLTANRSAMANFIFRPRSDLLFSAEYRHLRTSEIGAFYTADQVNMMMGVLF